MPLTGLIEVTAPVYATPAAGPAIPPGISRRPLTFAALTRRAARRATWIRAERAGVLSPVAMAATVAGAVTLTFMLGAWAVVL